jgi:hypothetical protein
MCKCLLQHSERLWSGKSNIHMHALLKETILMHIHLRNLVPFVELPFPTPINHHVLPTHSTRAQTIPPDPADPSNLKLYLPLL